MIVIGSECCDCDLPCIFEACPYYKVVYYVCDKCGETVDDLYYFDGEQLCVDCILKQLEKVEYED
jgi:hypothetical protein